MGFTGFPAGAFEFYERLAADNSKAFWQANKGIYESAVKTPFQALLAEFPEQGPFQVFRPYRDVRFSKDKTPYKENAGGYGEAEGGTGFYVALDANGMFAGSGYYSMAPDQLERFRHAVDAEGTGSELAGLCAAAEKKGFRTGAIGELKTAPRGYSKDHPRIALLRRKGLFVGIDWPRADWMHTRKVVAKVRGAWEAGAPVSAWLDAHVGPSTMPPEDRFR